MPIVYRDQLSRDLTPAEVDENFRTLVAADAGKAPAASPVFTGTATFSGPAVLNGTATFGAAATFNAAATFSGDVTYSALTANTALVLDGSKRPTSVTLTGTGNVVRATSPTLTTPTLATATLTSPTMSGVTFSDGTPNTVPYLNGSSVVVSGTQLSYNGAHFGVGGPAAAIGSNITTIQATGGNATDTGGLRLRSQDASRSFIYYGAGSLGYIGSETNHPLVVFVNGTDALRISAADIRPGADNAFSCGTAPFRWSTVFAANGTINTSDAREKTTVRQLTANELAAAKALAKEIGVFQFLEAIQRKGDKARQHIGMTVQRAIEIMQANDLDPMAYGFICHDKWEDEFVERPADGDQPARREQTQHAGDRYGFRTDQLLLFIAAGFEARLAALEAA